MPVCLLFSQASRCRRSGLACRRALTRAADSPATRSEKYVIIGAGFAGVATAFHLLESAPQSACVQITVYDVHGLGGGASGAAAGLLHPFSPKGKLTWLGLEGFAATSRLIKAAEAADARCKRQHGAAAELDPVAFRTGILRIGGHARQSWELTQFLEQVQAAEPSPEDRSQSAAHSAALSKHVTEESRMVVQTSEAVTAAQAGGLVPGISGSHVAHAAEWRPARRGRNGKADRALEALGTPDKVGVHIPRAVTVNSPRYLEALWAACQDLVAAKQPSRCAVLATAGAAHAPAANAATAAQGWAAAAPPPDASFLRLQRRVVESLQELAGDGEYDAVIVASGAAAAALPEVPDSLSTHMDLSHGCCITLEAPDPPDSHSTQHAAETRLYGPAAPSVLGAPYAGVVRRDKAVVGSSREPVADAAAALDVLRRRASVAGEAAAEAELRAGIEAAWPSFRGWRTTAIKSGVRAIPKFTEEGAPPLLGSLGCAAAGAHAAHGTPSTPYIAHAALDPAHDSNHRCASDRGAGSAGAGQEVDGGGGHQGKRRQRWWLYTRLGTRGLLYHALMAELLVAAIRADDDSLLPPALRRWQYP